VDCGWVKIRWVDEELGGSAVALYACRRSDGLSSNGVKGINCSMNVW